MSNNKFNQLIANPQLAAKTLADALGLEVEREVADGVWLLGVFHRRTLYFAAEPNAELRARLMTDRHAVFVFAVANADTFNGYPDSCVHRGRSLTDVLKLDIYGEIVPDADRLDELAPRRTAGIINGRRGNGNPIAARRVEWVRFFAYWYAKCRDEKKARRPEWKEIAAWFAQLANNPVGNDEPSIRTLQRDLRTLTHYDGRGVDMRSSDITLMWEKVDDESFVLNLSKDHPLPEVVKAAFARLGRGCDPTAIRPLPGGKAAFQEAC